ncbi:MAG TPA: prenyltransferase/squalene oxidase repeat-containing protein, partial [Candidatus Eisenbacteria bacterium]|jgi:squalene-hopene/tetraprenyl-beta-curcumene cyclase|nr:prenyltransferase/squalene oxidase repeat-containing protein [Candidatus Eisenbacteria bacterium]
LTGIQPTSGGFLEATPLTSFVVMSLAGSGQVNHPVAAKGVEFLLKSQRVDGSWPIDTNLATWVTTLAVNAIADRQSARDNNRSPSQSQILNAQQSNPLASGDWRLTISRWLLGQQYRERHPYTNSPPGGWAWTDMPGGVPDADDTAGALLALRHLGAMDERTRQAAIMGITWLLDLQNRDGGIPTFCRGWGTLPFDRSGADLTAHALRAWAAWIEDVPEHLQQRMRAAIYSATNFLSRAQRRDGAWIPLWFGNQFAPGDENPTYGTARVLDGILKVHQMTSSSSTLSSSFSMKLEPLLIDMLSKGAHWLLTAQNPDGSWGGFRQGQSSIEETALAVEALAGLIAVETTSALASIHLPLEEIKVTAASGANWLIERVESGAWKLPSPIGFYFAKLWYYERLYPMIFTTSALNQIARCG